MLSPSPPSLPLSLLPAPRMSSSTPQCRAPSQPPAEPAKNPATIQTARMNLPNLITIGRILLVPVVVLLIVSREWTWAFFVFVAAGISDAVDGFLAKRLDMRTDLGAIIDPLADKALLVSMYVALAVAGALPIWLAILVVSRDLLIVAAVLVAWVLDQPIEIRPLTVSKVNTAAQIGLAALVIAMQAFAFSFGGVLTGAIVLVAGLTVVSYVAYLAVWLRHMNP
jgi:cardiolipin synthase